MEVKYKPKKVTCAESKFECEFGSKTDLLVVRMVDPLWGSIRAAIVASEFDYVTSVSQIKNRELSLRLSSRRSSTGQSTQRQKRQSM